jgi:hypothetical protein
VNCRCDRCCRRLLCVGPSCTCWSDLRDKAKRALKAMGAQCAVLGAMQDLLPKAPLPILKVFLAQFEKVCVHLLASYRAVLVKSACMAADATIDVFVACCRAPNGRLCPSTRSNGEIWWQVVG